MTVADEIPVSVMILVLMLTSTQILTSNTNYTKLPNIPCVWAGKRRRAESGDSKEEEKHGEALILVLQITR